MAKIEAPPLPKERKTTERTSHKWLQEENNLKWLLALLAKQQQNVTYRIVEGHALTQLDTNEHVSWCGRRQGGVRGCAGVQFCNH